MRFYSSAFAKIDKVNSGSAVALGCFDGVHIGHSQIIGCAVNFARERALSSVVWSFQEPPKNILSGQSEPSLLTTLDEKKSLMRALGVDAFISAPFNEEISRLTPREFFEDILISRLNAKHIFCGFNYRFGHMGSGNTELLSRFCKERGIALTVIDEIKVDGITVSSSAIRAYILDGELDMAEKMLGRPFSLAGKVIDGQHLGRALGFPTVNQDVPRDKISVRNGVYLTRVRIGKACKYGITNIGMRPTVNGVAPVCETHILDFSGNLYGKRVSVEFLKFIRSERKFASLDELKAQVESDIALAKAMVENRK